MLEDTDASTFVTKLLLTSPLPIQELKNAFSSIDSNVQLELNIQLIVDTSPQAVVKIICNILGTAVTATQLCELIFSVRHIEDPHNQFLKIVADVLGNFISAEYPNTAKKFLIDYLELDAAVSPWNDLARDVIRHIEQNESMYDALPQLKELSPSSKKWSIYNAWRRQVSREIHEYAESKSIFASIFQTVTLKYGRAFTSNSENNFNPVTELEAFSHFIELPRSETYDPVLGMRRRFSYLAEGRK